MALFPRTGRPQFAPLAPEDAAPCATLHAESFAHGWSEIDFERLLAAQTTITDAARHGRETVGFILSRRAADEAEVLTIVVAPRWRRQALGRTLLTLHRERLALERVRHLFLEVNEDNVAARALYRAAGFVEVGRRKAYYPGGVGQAGIDALILRGSTG